MYKLIFIANSKQKKFKKLFLLSRILIKQYGFRYFFRIAFEEFFKQKRSLFTSDIMPKLDFKQFTAFLKEDPEYFVIGETKFEQIMAMESKIAILCGIPFDYNRGIMTPLTRINVKELSQGAPSEVVKKLNDIYNQLKSV